MTSKPVIPTFKMDGHLSPSALYPEHINITQSFPFEFHYVKALYLNHQYKECIHRCEELLLQNKNEPAHVVFLNFYAALSHESLARLMHVFSVWRLPKITAAESAYQRALDACSDRAHPCEDKANMSTPSDAQVESKPLFVMSEKIYTHKVRSKPSVASPDAETETSSAKPPVKRAERINFSWPRDFTPLSCATVKAIQDRVLQDMIVPLEDPFTEPSSETSSLKDTRQDSASHGLSPNDHDEDSKPNKQQTHDTSPPYTSPPFPQTSSAHRTYTSHLHALTNNLSTHLTQIRALKHTTITEQAARSTRKTQSLLPTTADAQQQKSRLPQSRSFWSFKDPQAEKNEKQARIEEGRARGWQRERFDGGKYVDLTEEALAELQE